MKLCLGTVQFGLDYGIRQKQKPDIKSCLNMLEYALQNGIQEIDTAEAYGNAHEVVAVFLQKNLVQRDSFQLGSKVLPHLLDDVPQKEWTLFLKKNLEKTLKFLGTDYLDYYLFHTASYAFSEEKLAALANLKKIGLVRRTGISVYEPKEALSALKSISVDHIQLPYSIFDRRMNSEGIFEHHQKKIIHTRSAFLQGMLLMSPETLPAHLQVAKSALQGFHRICQKHACSPQELAIWFVRATSPAASLVFGVRDIEQLKEDIRIFEQAGDPEAIREVQTLILDLPKNIVMPSLWKNKGIKNEK